MGDGDAMICLIFDLRRESPIGKDGPAECSRGGLLVGRQIAPSAELLAMRLVAAPAFRFGRTEYDRGEQRRYRSFTGKAYIYPQSKSDEVRVYCPASSLCTLGR
jgi:hypothetical protein